MAHGLEAIDWAAPWLAPWGALGEAATLAIDRSTTQAASPATASATTNALSVAAALNAMGQTPKRFVPQSELPAGVAYEEYISATGCVPTRDGLHDFFNGLAWHHFPQTKLRLNALQAAQIASSGIQPVRGPARDALTVFDENAALLQAPDALWQALSDKDWHSAFVTLRPLWTEAQLILFGHALLEKLVAPRKPITAHVYRVTCPSRARTDIDVWLAGELSAERLAEKPFAHLPILGVPGWWPENEDPVFYADNAVFRAPRAVVQNP